MSKRLKVFFSILILVIFGLFFSNPAKYMTSLFEGLSIWATSVLPALLPFVLLAKLFVSLDAFSQLFYREKFLPKLLNSPPQGAYIMILSMLCGYPIGAKLICQQFEEKLVSTTQAKKLASFCSTAGPVYLIATVGIKILGSVTAGILILTSHFLANFLNGVLFRREFVDNSPILPPKMKNQQQGFFSDAMLDSINSVLAVGGFVAVFYMLCQMIFDILPTFFVTDGQIFAAYFLGILEMTNGCLLLSQSADIFSAVVLSCSLVSFGGICVLLQCMTFFGKCGIKTKTIFALKLSHSAIATLVCFALTCVCRYFGGI